MQNVNMPGNNVKKIYIHNTYYTVARTALAKNY